MTRRINIFYCLVALFCSIATAFAGSVETTPEIKALLTFIEQSPCIIERNGDHHIGPEAAAHVKKKYEYFKDKITTAEDFIRYSATRSTITRRDYRVSCPDGYQNTTQKWLLGYLKRIRETDGRN